MSLTPISGKLSQRSDNRPHARCGDMERLARVGSRDRLGYLHACARASTRDQQDKARGEEKKDTREARYEGYRQASRTQLLRRAHALLHRHAPPATSQLQREAMNTWPSQFKSGEWPSQFNSAHGPLNGLDQLLLAMHGRMHKRGTHASTQHHNLIYTCFRITTQQL